MRVLARGEVWSVKTKLALGDRTLFKLRALESGDEFELLSPPDEVVVLPTPSTGLDRSSLAPFGIWKNLHEAIRLSTPEPGVYAAFHAGRIQPEPYQFAPVAKLIGGTNRNLLIADDVGLGKTIEAGICLFELIARGVGKRILLVVPPGLIPQWLDEMWEKFGLEFRPIENSSSLDRAQTLLSEGVQPWIYFDRVITSTEYLKRRDVHISALARPWDVIVVDEAHYLAESGSPASPYSTARSRLGPRLKEVSRALILLTATPHNGYRHSFRSLLELVEPTNATLAGSQDAVRRRIERSMIRRLKPQITRAAANGIRVPAFPARMPVERVQVQNLSSEEREIFSRVSTYCARTIGAAEGSDEADIVSFAMQIIKKRMLSSRHALHRTIDNRLEALSIRAHEDPPSRSELREIQGDLPLSENVAERTSLQILRTAVARDARRRTAEKKQLKEIQRLLKLIEDRPDPKIATFIGHLEREVLGKASEKAIVFTEYRDTLEALRTALTSLPGLQNAFVELTGGLSPAQRKARIARFHDSDCKLLVATDAASEGLNLQRQCRRLYHFELPWNPNRLEQRNGRIDRHGQTRSPLVAYLFYPDSPEDGVLDRLIQRISTMHDDKVSTPDILGILSETRIEEALARIDTPAAADSVARGIIEGLEEQCKEVSQGIAPLLLAGAQGADDDFANSLSADLVMVDDHGFEEFMLRQLGDAARPGRLPGTYRIEVPRVLQGPAVAQRYESATFRRSVAVLYPAAEVEFIHRLHPLFRTVSALAYRELTLVSPGDGPGSRIAVRRHSSVKENPVAIFTFFERLTHPDGALLALGLSGDKAPVSETVVDQILRDDGTATGEVSWAECLIAFEAKFDALVECSRQTAHELVSSRAAITREERARKAAVLRDEAKLYKQDRLAEIAAEEAAERAGARAQMEMFRETATNWKARRAAIETHYTNRLREIDTFVAVPEPPEPQPLGVLLVFPEA